MDADEPLIGDEAREVGEEGETPLAEPGDGDGVPVIGRAVTKVDPEITVVDDEGCELCPLGVVGPLLDVGTGAIGRRTRRELR